MGTPYSGVAASLTTGVSITVPADLDPDNGATFAVGMQKLADYAEAFRARVRSGAILTWGWIGTQAGTFAATNSLVTVVPTGSVLVVATMGSDVTASTSPHKLTANVAGTYRVWLSRYLGNANANVVNASFQKNGGTAINTPAGVDLGVISTGSQMGGSSATGEAYLTLAATDFMQVAFYGTSGQAYAVSGGNIQWFGLERIA